MGLRLKPYLQQAATSVEVPPISRQTEDNAYGNRSVRPWVPLLQTSASWARQKTVRPWFRAADSRGPYAATGCLNKDGATRKTFLSFPHRGKRTVPGVIGGTPAGQFFFQD